MTLTPDELKTLQDVYAWANAILSDGRTLVTKLDTLIKGNQAPLVFSWPIGDINRRTLAPWFDATGYAALYNNNTAYHTGNDLNLAAFGDSGASVYACADGEIVFAGVVQGWQAQVVVIKHVLEDGRLIWSRYAHIKDVTPIGAVKRGDLLGHIADYTPAGPQGDHLHFDLAWIDLGAKPGDWPGLNKARVLTDYVDGCKWIAEHLA